MTKQAQKHLPFLFSNLRVLLPLLAYKAFIFVTIFLSFRLLPGMFSSADYAANFHWPLDSAPDLSSLFKTWDGQLFLFISQMGYHKESMSVAFYPLWPGLIWLVSYVTGGSHLIVGLVLSNIFSLLGAFLLHRLICDSLGTLVADRALLLLLAFPGALFFSFVYSESLFFFLTMLFFIFLARSQYMLVGAAAFMLALTRQVGIFFILPLVWEVASKKEPFQKWFVCLAPILGLGTYFLIMFLSVGDAWAGFKGQDFFVSQASIGKIFNVVAFARTLFFTPLEIHGMLNSAIDRFWFLGFAASLFFIWKQNKTYFIYALVMGVVPAMTVSFMSYTRYVLIIFPIFIVAAQFFSKESRKVWFWMVLSSLFSVQIIFLLRHINNYWVG